MVKPAGHRHFLRGVRFLGGGGAPSLLKRKDQEFVASLLREVRTEAGRAEARRTLAADRDARSSALRLWQPVHRTFHLACLEVLCDEPGSPRANPRRIEGAGMVVRRLAQRRDANGTPLPVDLKAPPGSHEVEGWMRDGDVIHGWQPLRGGRRALDPDPKHRRPPLRAGHPAVTALLRQPDAEWDRWQETVVPLFTAPPDACEAAGATLLYGVLPLTSSERAEHPGQAPKADPDGEAQAIPPSLRPGTWSLPAVLKPDELPDDEAQQARFLARIGDVSLLRGLGAFEATPEAARLLEHLNGVAVWREGDPKRVATRKLGDVLKQAAAVFESDGARGIGEAAEWTVPAGTWQAELRRRMAPLLNARIDEMTSQVGRYDRPGALYQVQAFVRVRECDECPPVLVWSEPSEPFSIVPWYEAGDAAPVRIPLPEAKLSEMARLKPNVAFQVPASLQDALQGMKLKKPLEIGKGSAGITVDWICGFSIPLITLCAFIVLNIFLQLLNIIFWWLPFIKICIPIPRRSPSPRL
jgi:hypothetical protein